jgi:glutathione peroxidase
MRYIITLFLVFVLNNCAKEQTMPLYDIEVKTINGKVQTMEAYQGQVLLIVNVASRCGFTSQYSGLESLYQRYKEQGFTVLGFPCNQFGSQEPGSEAEISNFCQVNFGVTFPMFAKINVNGDNTHPLYRLLKSEQKGLMGSEAIKWNFTKFLVDRQGNVIKRYASATTPENIAADIETLLNQ